MKAFLIDREIVGGGLEYVRRKMAGCPCPCQVFFSERGECTAARLNRWGADEIVVNHLKPLLQLFRNPFCQPRGRVTFVVHGVHWRKYDWMIHESRSVPRKFILIALREMRRMLERRLYHRCDRMVALTETDRADILRFYGTDLDVEVEPNTLDGWAPQLAERPPDGVVGHFKHICIGRFFYQKGQDRWIRAMARLPEKVRTLFIGDGSTLDECKALAKNLGVADRCVFAGEIPDADRYLKCAEVVVSPSRWEGMPYLLMKARALGCKILATDCPGNRDVLEGYDKWEKLEL